MPKDIQDLLIAKAAIEIRILAEGADAHLDNYTKIMDALNIAKVNAARYMTHDAKIIGICDEYGMSEAAIDKAKIDNAEAILQNMPVGAPIIAGIGGAAVADIPKNVLDESIDAFNTAPDFDLAQAMEASLLIVQPALGGAASADKEQKVIEESVASESARAHKAAQNEEAEFKLAIAASENQFSADDAKKAAHLSDYVSNLRAELASKASWYDSIKHDLRLFSNLMYYNGAEGAAGRASAVWEESDMNIVKGKLVNHMLELTEDHTDAGMKLLAKVTDVLYPE